MTYRYFVVRQHGGPDVLQWEQAELPLPGDREIRVKVQAAGVAFGDLLWMSGKVPGGPKLPFTPGYDMVGVVDAVGSGVTNIQTGDRVAGLLGMTHHGGYAEYATLPTNHAVPVPDGLEPVDVAALTLNYLTALQIFKRIGGLENGQRVLIHGAAGGAGTAMLDVGRALGLETYGTASAPKHDIVRELGGTPIDYRSEDFVSRIKELTGDGVDLVVDPIGGNHFARSFKTLRRDGTLVATSAYAAIKGDARTFEVITSFLRVFLWNILPNQKSSSFFNVPDYCKQHVDHYRDDLTTLLHWLKEGKVKPLIDETMPLENAPQALQKLLDANVRGKLVLLP
ncbi:MAG: zinc-binding dehydrogenase [Chloroflexi bacterium]|nr:zinc-binding dehydrogenase [Chloroflexota bacterium]